MSSANACFGFSAISQAQLFNVKPSKLLRTEGNGRQAGKTGNIAQASTVISQEHDLEWVKKDKRRMLHVVYRVGDMDKTIKYVCSAHEKFISLFLHVYVLKWIYRTDVCCFQILHRVPWDEAVAET